MQDNKLELAVELAAKVRGYFTNPDTGKPDMPKSLDGDWDLYNLASRITHRVLRPGNKGE